MIFVTVGTHEQQFNRLVECIDKLKAAGKIEDRVVIQTGFSDYVPTACEYSKLYPYDKMLELVNEARIVITHGGPSSFIMPLQVGKIPVVVPRKCNLGEHVNDHQVDFCNAVAQRQGNILVVENVENLGEIINNYDLLVSAMPTEMKSNNAEFCARLEDMTEKMFE